MCEQSSSIEVAEHVQVDLAAHLARRIRRRRVDGHVLGGRVTGRDAVDRPARRGVHDLAHAGLAGRLCQPHRADDVDAGVELRIVHRVLHRDLRRQMKHHLGLDVGEQDRVRSASTMSALTNRSRRGARRGRGCSLRPELRSSTPTTECPSARRRSTSVDPMKPAAPVTSARTGPPYRRGSEGSVKSGRAVDDVAVASSDQRTPRTGPGCPRRRRC